MKVAWFAEVLHMKGAGEKVFIPVRPICDFLGVDWPAQCRRINRDAVLAEVVSGVAVTATPLSSKFANPQEMTCLPLDYSVCPAIKLSRKPGTALS